MKDTPMEDEPKEDGPKEDKTKEDESKEDDFSAMVTRLQKTLDELVEGIANTGDAAKQVRNDIAVIRTIARMMEDEESKSTHEAPEDSTQDC